MLFKVLIVLFQVHLFHCSFVQTRPNIIIIMSDDMGWNDFGFHGQNQIPTPNIDALAYNGIVLNRFYTQQSCTPSRAALLTGNYPFKIGAQGLPIDAGEDRYLPPNMPTMADHLRQLGYKTHLIGKWHLGAAKKSSTPTEKGFDTFFGYWNGWIGYYNYVMQTPLSACNITGLPPSIKAPPSAICLKGFDLHDGHRPAWEHQGEYATTLFTNKALERIKAHDKKEPLFLFLSHLAGHSGKDSLELEVPDITENDREFSYIKDVDRRRYAGIVKEFDVSVGKVMKALEEKNILHNSIVFVLSDNGAPTAGVYANKGSNWPLRGIKLTPLEGAVRGSALIYSPLLKVKTHINNELMHITDLMPTFYAAAGGKVSHLGDIDGIDQWRSLQGETKTSRQDIILNIEELFNWSAIIGKDGRYKLLNGTFDNGIYDRFYGETGRDPENPSYNISAILSSEANAAIRTVDHLKQLTQQKILQLRKKLDISDLCNETKRLKTDRHVCQGYCLYDLFNDPCETTDLAAENPKIVDKLKARMGEYWVHVKRQEPKYIDPRANPINCNNSWFLWKETPACV